MKSAVALKHATTFLGADCFIQICDVVSEENRAKTRNLTGYLIFTGLHKVFICCNLATEIFKRMLSHRDNLRCTFVKLVIILFQRDTFGAQSMKSCSGYVGDPRFTLGL